MVAESVVSNERGQRGGGDAGALLPRARAARAPLGGATRQARADAVLESQRSVPTRLQDSLVGWPIRSGNVYM